MNMSSATPIYTGVNINELKTEVERNLPEDSRAKLSLETCYHRRGEGYIGIYHRGSNTEVARVNPSVGPYGYVGATLQFLSQLPREQEVPLSNAVKVAAKRLFR